MATAYSLILFADDVSSPGTHSAKDTKENEAQAVWSMAFETLNPNKLKHEHDDMVKELYGIKYTGLDKAHGEHPTYNASRMFEDVDSLFHPGSKDQTLDTGGIGVHNGQH